MDFFGAQSQAKTRTGWAIVLFILATVASAVAIYIVYELIWYGFFSSHENLGRTFTRALPSENLSIWQFLAAHFDLKEFLILQAATIGVILGASLFKIAELGQGGVAIANSLGARFVDPTIDDEKGRILVNVVEEMSIASGYPMPQVAVLDNEAQINAFAAALEPKDAVIVVTAGTLNTLNREELQAVIGHEFSHLVNGDSRININLAGWIAGLFFIFIIGRILLRTRGRKNPLPVFGLALIIIGLIGYLFGRIIQALISRQREYLADASSVQFTRNPGAMVGALDKIRQGSTIGHHASSGMAHFFFASASPFSDSVQLFATHPPLEKRIAAIGPNYQLKESTQNS